MSDRYEAARAALAAAEAATAAPSPATAGATPVDSVIDPDAGTPEAVAGADGPEPAGMATTSGAERPADLSATRARALRYLAMCAHSEAELRVKLARREHCAESIDIVVRSLLAAGLLDDRVYAQQLVRVRSQVRGQSRSAIALELKRRGVDPDLAADALVTVTDDAERERAEALVAKKLATMAGQPAQVQLRRLAGLLARKGYPTSVARAVIQDAVSAAREHQRD